MADLSKGARDYFLFGDWNIACSMCGRKRKFSELVKNWQGLYRCPEHNEPRHPQDFVRGEADIQTAPVVQDQIDLQVNFCTPTGNSALPSFAVPGCMIPGLPILATPDPIMGFCQTYQGTLATPALAIPGCMIPGRRKFL